jgi:hypothetical protein
VKQSDLESRITTDINQTLNLFNYTIPGILGGVYATGLLLPFLLLLC